MTELESALTGRALRHILERQAIMMGVMLDILNNEEAAKLYKKKWKKHNQQYNKDLDTLIEGAKNGK